MNLLFYIEFNADQITISIDGLTILAVVVFVVLVSLSFHRNNEENT